MENMEIRTAIVAAGVRYWEVAEAMGIHDVTFARKLRRELPPEEKATVMEAIERAAKVKEVK